MAQAVTFAMLADWIEERLPPEETRRITAAVEADSALEAAAAWIREFHCLAGELLVADPPATVRQELEGLFEGHCSGEDAPLSFRRHEAVFAGERADGQESQLFYSTPAGNLKLVMRQRLPAAQFDLHGVFYARAEGEELPVFAAELQDEQWVLALQASDPWGEFSFSRLPAGRYRLLISGEAMELSISDLRLGDDQDLLLK
jgi:hypothetical protein